jgi:hypothetical protein
MTAPHGAHGDLVVSPGQSGTKTEVSAMAYADPNFKAPAQKPLPHPVREGANYDGLTVTQLVENLRVAEDNLAAWPQRPIGGFKGGATPGQNSRDYERACYAPAGIEAALSKLWRAKHGERSQPPGINEWLDGATL